MNRQKEFSDKGRYTEIRKVTEGGGGGSTTAIKVFKLSMYAATIDDAEEVIPEYISDAESGDAYFIAPEEDSVIFGSNDGEVPDIRQGMPSNLTWAVYDNAVCAFKDGYDDGEHGPLPVISAL